MRILCIDIGKRRIGVALSDDTELLARGLTVIERAGREMEELRELVEKYAVGSVIFGLPLRMDGSMSSQTEKTLAFAERLKKVVGVPVVAWDERLSTRRAETILLEADISRKKRKKLIDKLSAQIILQDYLDAHREPPEIEPGIPGDLE